jgi:hypothetical protein
MDAETVTLNLVADMPSPLPKPAAAALLGIADDFARIQGQVAGARSLSLRANLPIPVPMPGTLPIPPPRVLAEQARQAKELALRMAKSIEKRMPETGAQATLGPVVSDLISWIGTLPVPLP